MIRTNAEEIKRIVLNEVSGFARRDSDVDKILDILIQAGIIEQKPLESGGSFIHINSIHNHDNAYEDMGENFLGDGIKG